MTRVKKEKNNIVFTNDSLLLLLENKRRVNPKKPMKSKIIAT